MYCGGLRDGVTSRKLGVQPQNQGETPVLANVYIIDRNPCTPSENEDKRGDLSFRDQ